MIGRCPGELGSEAGNRQIRGLGESDCVSVLTRAPKKILVSFDVRDGSIVARAGEEGASEKANDGDDVGAFRE